MKDGRVARRDGFYYRGRRKEWKEGSKGIKVGKIGTKQGWKVGREGDRKIGKKGTRKL